MATILTLDWPVYASTVGKINYLVMNARSLKSYHKDSTTNWQSVCNLHDCFQDLVYAENSEVIYVNETWLNQNISNFETLNSGFPEIGLIEVIVEFLSQSKQPPSKLSKNLNLNRKPSCNSLRSFLPKSRRLLVKDVYSVFAMGHPMKTQVRWMYSIIFCMKFVTSSTIW